MIETLIGVWRVLDRRQRRRLVLLQILAVVMACCTISGIAAVLPFFTVLADPGAINDVVVLTLLYERFQFDDERQFVAALGVCFVGIVFLANAVNLAGAIAMNRFALWVGDELHVTLFDAYLHRGYQFHAGTNSSGLSINVIHETGRVTTGLLQGGLTLITNLIAVIFILASIIFVNAAAALAVIVGLGAGYLLTYALARRRLLDGGRIVSRYAAERTKVVNESFGAIKEVIAAQREDFFVERFARSCRSMSRTIAEAFVISQSPRHILESLAVGGLVGIALLLSGRENAVGPWLAQLTFVGFAAYRLLPALQQVFAAAVRLRADRAAFESIAEDLRLARSRSIATRARGLDDRDLPRRELRLHRVSFGYSNDDSPAVRDVTLWVASGSAIGVVGPNGSGKTTLADLIAGLLAPQSGYIEVDGIALDESNRPSWQASVAYVPQESFLLDATVAENIALGVPPKDVDHARMLRAARLARLDECIAALPNGYDEVLGERGARLSAGQRRRVGIARALYRNASVLIMDEATNALDAPTERDLVATLQELRGQYTVVLITHRLSTLQHCDLIVEMQNGAIVRQWTHEDWLRASDGLRITAPRAERTR